MNVGYFATNLGVIPNARAKTGIEIMKNAGKNLGNLAFWYAARRLFTDDVVLIGWGSKPQEFADDVDIFVIPAANFLNPAVDLSALADLVEGLNKPVLVFGLGAQSVDEDAIPQLQPGTVRFLKAVAARTPKIFLRGAYTKRVCEHYGVRNVQVAGCPSLFINPDKDLGSRVQNNVGKIEKLYVASATFSSYTYPFECSLFSAAMERPGSTYVIQDPWDFLDIIDGREIAVDAEVEAVLAALMPNQPLHEATRKFSQVSRYFTGIPEWLEAAALHDYAVSTRIHGAIVALMAGVPSVVVGHDARVRELAAACRIPCVSGSAVRTDKFDLEEFRSSVAFDGVLFDENRAEIAGLYQQLMKEVGLAAAPFLSEITG
jgi:hypothetical protein